PLVEATVADATGVLQATFFNQPWLVQRYPAGTRLALYGKYQGRGRFRVSEHRVTDALAGSESVAVYAASEGITSSELHALVDAHRDAIGDVVEPLPARWRAAERLPDRGTALDAVHFGGAPGWEEGGRRRLAFDELLLVQLLFWRRRARHASSAAPVLDQPGELTRRWLRDVLPFAP